MKGTFTPLVRLKVPLMSRGIEVVALSALAFGQLAHRPGLSTTSRRESLASWRSSLVAVTAQVTSSRGVEASSINRSRKDCWPVMIFVFATLTLNQPTRSTSGN